MHPEIEEFWKNSGYEIDILKPVTSDVGVKERWRYMYYLKKGERYSDFVGCSQLFVGNQSGTPKCEFYFFDKKQLTEEEMLRIVRLKAFI